MKNNLKSGDWVYNTIAQPNLPAGTCGKIMTTSEAVIEVTMLKEDRWRVFAPNQLRLTPKLECFPEQVDLFRDWISQGGIAVWNSSNSASCTTFSTAFYDINGNKTPKQKEFGRIIRIVQMSEDINVVISKEVERFSIETYEGTSRLTAESLKKIRNAESNVRLVHGDARHEIVNKEVVILIPDKIINLDAYCSEPKIQKKVEGFEHAPILTRATRRGSSFWAVGTSAGESTIGVNPACTDIQEGYDDYSGGITVPMPIPPPPPTVGTNSAYTIIPWKYKIINETHGKTLSCDFDEMNHDSEL